MKSINIVVLSGNLTRDPELRAAGETSVVKLGLAVNESYKKGGEWKERASFFDIEAWGKLAENCANYLFKGSHIVVTGRLIQQSWEADDGSKRYKVLVRADTIEFPRKADRDSGGDESGYADDNGGDTRFPF